MPAVELNKVYHVINIPSREQTFIRELMEDGFEKLEKVVAIRAAGEAAEGILSNPNLAWLAGGGILAAVAAAVGKDRLDDLTNYFGSVQRALAPEATDEEKRGAVNEMARFLKDIIPFGFLVPTP